MVGSDSGRIVILEYSAERGQFQRVHQETFGKTGCRRIVPGQFLAVDPRGRAVMVGAVEKQKMVRCTELRTARMPPRHARRAWDALVRLARLISVRWRYGRCTS